jgi:hypothetical protein
MSLTLIVHPLCLENPVILPTWCLLAYLLPALLDGVLQGHECGEWCMLVVLLGAALAADCCI